MIGTYVFLTEIPSKEKKITKTIFTCSDKKCINYLKNLNDNFCNICGSKITFLDFVETVN